MAKTIASGTFCRRLRVGILQSVFFVGTSIGLGFFAASPPASAAIQTSRFDAFRPEDGDVLNFVIHYDDSSLIASSVTSLCGSDPTAQPAPGCYVQNTANGYLPGPVSPLFQGYQIVNVTGTYYDKVEDETFTVLGLYQEESFEGGIMPTIPHYASDNLFDPAALFSAISSGGFVVETDNLAYQYHLFINKETGEYAGCGSGPCRKVVRMVPGPLPLVGAMAAFGFGRKMRRRVASGRKPLAG